MNKFQTMQHILSEEIPDAEFFLDFGTDYNACFSKDIKGNLYLSFDMETFTRLTTDECISILYHEIGHYKRGHLSGISNVLWCYNITTMLPFSFIVNYLFMLCFIPISLLLLAPYHGQFLPDFIALILPFLFVFSFLPIIKISRDRITQHEMEADDYSISKGYGLALINARLCTDIEYLFLFSNSIIGMYPDAGRSLEHVFKQIQTT